MGIGQWESKQKYEDEELSGWAIKEEGGCQKEVINYANASGLSARLRHLSRGHIRVTFNRVCNETESDIGRNIDGALWQVEFGQHWPPQTWSSVSRYRLAAKLAAQWRR